VFRVIEPKKDQPSKVGSRYHESMNSDHAKSTAFDAEQYAIFDRLPTPELAWLRDQARKAAKAMASDLYYESNRSYPSRFEGQS
jgi:hypothetical protein